jgi:hypothetical protein
MKKVIVGLAFALGLVSGAGTAWADCGKHGSCPFAEKSRSAESVCPLTGKVIDKAKFYLKHADKIGLSDEQVQTIKTIKLTAKKASILGLAQMEAFGLDVKAKMSEPIVDVEGLNAMVDEFSQEAVIAMKERIADYAKLRAVLSTEQKEKAKGLWKKSS